MSFVLFLAVALPLVASRGDRPSKVVIGGLFPFIEDGYEYSSAPPLCALFLLSVIFFSFSFFRCGGVLLGDRVAHSCIVVC